MPSTRLHLKHFNVRKSIAAYQAASGMVTNGEGWKFYRLTSEGDGFESLLNDVGEMSILLGILRKIFQFCEENFKEISKS